MRLRAFPIEALALYTHAAFVLLRDAIIEKGTGSSAGRTDTHTQVDLTSHQGRARLLFYILLDTNNTFSFSPVNLSLSLSLSLSVDFRTHFNCSSCRRLPPPDPVPVDVCWRCAWCARYRSTLLITNSNWCAAVHTFTSGCLIYRVIFEEQSFSSLHHYTNELIESYIFPLHALLYKCPWVIHISLLLCSVVCIRKKKKNLKVVLIRLETFLIFLFRLDILLRRISLNLLR
jgi:hypothetical protein